MEHTSLTEIRAFIGGHRMAASHIYSTIQKNAGLLREQKIHFVEPNLAKKSFALAIKDTNAAVPVAEVQANLLNSWMPDWEPETLVIGHEGFSGSIIRPFSGPNIYPSARGVVTRLNQILMDVPLTFLMGIRNPGTFAPSAYAESLCHANLKTLEEYIDNVDFDSMKWSSCARRIIEASGDQPVIMWRFEDYAYIWRDVVGAITGIENPQDLVPAKHKINRGLSLTGAELLLQEANKKGTKAFGELVAAHKKKHPAEDLPDAHSKWSETLVNRLSDKYKSDWQDMQSIEGLLTIPRRDYR